MKIKIESITDKINKKGNPYKVISSNGTNHYLFDSKLFDLFKLGEEIDVETEMQNGFSTILGVVKQEVSKPTAVDKPDWDGKDRRMVRMASHKVAVSIGDLLYRDVQMAKADVVNGIIAIAHKLEEDVYRE